MKVLSIYSKWCEIGSYKWDIVYCHTVSYGSNAVFTQCLLTILVTNTFPALCKHCSLNIKNMKYFYNNQDHNHNTCSILLANILTDNFNTYSVDWNSHQV